MAASKKSTASGRKAASGGSSAAPKKTSAAKKTAASKKTAAAKKSTAKRAATTSKKPAKKQAGARSATKSATKKQTTRPVRAAAAAKTARTSKPAKKTGTGRKRTARPAPEVAAALDVREDESPWTAAELEAVRAELQGDIDRLTEELSGFETEILGLMSEGGDGPGDDQADVGTKTFEREHEFYLAQNSRDLMNQSQHALDRIADGTYGTCERCGNPIGKMRLQAFPRATLCVSCKQKQERVTR